jgi:hypothetical protein
MKTREQMLEGLKRQFPEAADFVFEKSVRKYASDGNLKDEKITKLKWPR